MSDSCDEYDLLVTPADLSAVAAERDAARAEVGVLLETLATRNKTDELVFRRTMALEASLATAERVTGELTAELVTTRDARAALRQELDLLQVRFRNLTLGNNETTADLRMAREACMQHETAAAASARVGTDAREAKAQLEACKKERAEARCDANECRAALRSAKENSAACEEGLRATIARLARSLEKAKAQHLTNSSHITALSQENNDLGWRVKNLVRDIGETQVALADAYAAKAATVELLDKAVDTIESLEHVTAVL